MAERAASWHEARGSALPGGGRVLRGLGMGGRSSQLDPKGLKIDSSQDDTWRNEGRAAS